MKPIPPRTRYDGEVMPGAGDLASTLGNAGVDVVSSPALIGYLEMACVHAVEACFEPGEASVGVGFSMRHLAAAFPGRPVEVEAELAGQQGRRLTFKVRARQGGRDIMTGEHERAVVELERFLKSVADSPA